MSALQFSGLTSNLARDVQGELGCLVKVHVINYKSDMWRALGERRR